MKRLHLPLLVGVLLAVSAALFFYKIQVLKFPLTPESEISTWTVEASVAFTPTGGSVRAELQLPDHPPGFSVMDESFISRGYGLTTDGQDGQRSAVWTQRRPGGPQTLYYRVQLARHALANTTSDYPGPAAPPELAPPLATAAEALLADVRSRSADIDSFSRLLVQEVNRSDPNENVAAFLNRTATSLERAQLLVDLLAGARIPARIVHGFTLADRSQRQEAVPWLQYHNTRQWVPLDPVTGERGFPPDFLVWWTGPQASPLTLERAQAGTVTWAVSRTHLDAMAVASQRVDQRQLGSLGMSLLSLPVDVQNTYRVLLLIPLGALLIVVLRNVVGIRTFGTFMPVLMALSFRETELLNGVVLFSILVALGLALRFYLEHLKLLLVPRLAAVVTIVVGLMATLTVLSHQLDIQAGLSLGLFPIVVLAMTIERMSIVWEEHGASDAVQQGLGSLAVAVVSYVVLVNRYVEHLFFVFPELILAVLALTLLVGRYTGYRLSELIRFRALSRA